MTNVRNVFNAHQGKFGSQWLNVVPCKNLGLELDDQQLRISIGLRLGAVICVAHTCHCGKRVERDNLHSLSCTKSGVRDILPKDNSPKPNLPNVKDNLPNFFRQIVPSNLPNIVGTICRRPSVFK